MGAVEKDCAYITDFSDMRLQWLGSVALVGYTNVGKTTLLQRLAVDPEAGRSGPLPFETLDVRRRRVMLPTSDDGLIFACVVYDTIGFVRDLPEELFPAFDS